MRATGTCPKCSCKKILVSDLRHRQALSDNTERIDEIPVAGYFVRGFLKTTATVAGRFESWICAECGYTELYALDLGDVDRLAAEHPAVRIVDGTVPSKGPFR